MKISTFKLTDCLKFPSAKNNLKLHWASGSVDPFKTMSRETIVMTSCWQLKLLFFSTEKRSCRRRRRFAGIDLAEADGVDEGGSRPVDGDAAQEGSRPCRRSHGQEQRRSGVCPIKLFSALPMLRTDKPERIFTPGRPLLGPSLFVDKARGLSYPPLRVIFIKMLTTPQACFKNATITIRILYCILRWT